MIHPAASTLRFFALAAALFAAASPARAAGFDFCTRPLLPACIDNPKTYATPAGRDACDAEARSLIAATFAYRECIARNVENTLKATNEALDRYRCRKRGSKYCDVKPKPLAFQAPEREPPPEVPPPKVRVRAGAAPPAKAR